MLSPDKPSLILRPRFRLRCAEVFLKQPCKAQSGRVECVPVLFRSGPYGDWARQRKLSGSCGSTDCYGLRLDGAAKGPRIRQSCSDITLWIGAILWIGARSGFSPASPLSCMTMVSTAFSTVFSTSCSALAATLEITDSSATGRKSCPFCLGAVGTTTCASIRVRSVFDIGVVRVLWNGGTSTQGSRTSHSDSSSPLSRVSPDPDALPAQERRNTQKSATPSVLRDLICGRKTTCYFNA